jgi:aspartyl/asparaginyl beta-hydroxylase (cupin superfamily)
VQAGVQALRRRDAKDARALFAEAAAGDPANPEAQLGLAYAARDLGDDAGELAALDAVLALEPGNLRALLLKADHFVRKGDERAASGFYGAALRTSPPPERLPPDLQRELARARAALARSAGQYEAHLREQLAASGFGANSSGRFARGLELMTGKGRVWLQEPLFYYFPELPQRAFYERAEFPWMEAVEAATAAIRAELLEVMAGEEAFSPYVQAPVDRPVNDRFGLVDNPSWSALHLWRDGAPVPENADRCPRTMAALEGAPRAFIEGRTPIALFSRMTAGAHIPPHHGFVNTRLICHLPLIVPEGCQLRVGGETRAWREGEALIFDDTIEHEAWNRSGETRVVLLFDIWRPELSAEERGLVTAMFNAVDSYGGERVPWAG